MKICIRKVECIWNLHGRLSLGQGFAAQVNYLGDKFDIVSGNLSNDVCKVNISGNGSPVSVVEL